MRKFEQAFLFEKTLIFLFCVHPGSVRVIIEERASSTDFMPGSCSLCSLNFMHNDTLSLNKHVGDSLQFISPYCLQKKCSFKCDPLCVETKGTCHNIFHDFSCEFYERLEVNVTTRSSILKIMNAPFNIPTGNSNFVQDIMLRHSENLQIKRNLQVALHALIGMLYSKTEFELENAYFSSQLIVKTVSLLSRRNQELPCFYIKEIICQLLVSSDSLLEGAQSFMKVLSTRSSIEQSTSLHEKMFHMTSNILFFLENIVSVTSRCLVPSAKETILQTSKLFVWIKLDRPSEFVNISKKLLSQESFYNISPRLAEHLAEEPGLLSVQFMTAERGIFGLQRTNENFVNKIISLSFERKGGKRLRKLSVPIDLYFKIDKENKAIQTTQGNFINGNFVNDTGKGENSLVTVYRLQQVLHPGPGKISVKFFNITFRTLNVLLSENEPPNYEMMTQYSKEISTRSPLYEVNLRNHFNHNLNYLGILVRLNNTPIVRDHHSYSFQVRYIQCFSRFGMEWKSDGCYVGNETTEELLHCRCWHLSFFGGGAVISPRPLDIVNDVKLLVKINDNPKIFMVVCSLILLYFMFIVWTRHNDGKDRLQRYVVVLDDNFPGEQWAYLVTVFTGIWIGSSTDANVGIRLYGSKGMSRVHNLQSRERKVLKTNCDDWFLILTPKSLGDIIQIHVFHDHSGGSADWYCKNIIVYDIEGQKDYKFVIEKWVSLKEDDETAEYFVHPTPTLRSLKRDQIALDNVIFGLRETHILFSVFTRHPRTSVTRSQRLSICICMLFLHMLTSIMFYDFREDEDFPTYSSTKRKLIIGMESTFLSAPFTFIIIFCFKKSRIVAAPKGDVPMTLTSTQAVPLETGLAVNQIGNVDSKVLQENKYSSSTDTVTSSMSSFSGSYEDFEEEEEVEEEEYEEDIGCWKGFLQQIKNLLFQVVTAKAVMPLKIAEEDEGSARVRKQWMYFAWILCETTVFGSAFFTLIYSLKMDQKKCGEWMLQALTYSLANFFMMAPMKIIIFSTILALLYGHLRYVPSYECNFEAAIKSELRGNERFLMKLLELRRNKCYSPLGNKNTLMIRMLHKNWRHWRIVINFFVVVMLYLILTLEVLVTWNGLYYETQEHLEKMFGFDQPITSFSEYKKYLDTVVLPALDKRTWYNGETVSLDNVWKQEVGYAKDYSLKLMGLPVLRQLRVKEFTCRVHPAMAARFQHCNSPLTWVNMDTNDYYVGWTKLDRPKSESSTPWTFAPSNGPLVECGPITGNCYPSGGYSVKLDYDMKKTNETIIDLFKFQSEWFDGLTRVVFLELVLYNANTDFIALLSPMLERLAGGDFYFSIKSMVLHPRSSSFVESLVILSFFSFYYLVRIVFLFNRRGIKYLFSWTGLLDIFLNALMFCTMVSIFFYSGARKGYLDEWQLRQEDDLQFKPQIFLHRDLLRYESAILVIIIPVQLMHNMRFGKRSFVLIRTLYRCFSGTLGLGFLILVYYMEFKLLCAVNNVRALFCHLNRCYNAISYFRAVISQHLHIKSISIFFCLVTNVAAFGACVITIYIYKESKRRYRNAGDFNVFVFLGKNLRKTRQRFRKLRKKASSFGKERFRAGADDGGVSDEEFWPKNKPGPYTAAICSDVNMKLDTILEKLLVLEKTL